MARGVSRRVARAHAGALDGIDVCIELAGDPAGCDARAEAVSGWAVRDHLEHLLLGDESIFEWVEEVVAQPPEAGPEGRPSLAGALVLLLGFIPRNVGRAPESTIPAGRPRESIRGRFVDLKRRVEALDPDLPTIDELNVTRRHPVLGHLTPARYLRFVDIHHRHHARIIGDILEEGGRG